MTGAPSWPRIGASDRWTHLAVFLERAAPGPAVPLATFEIWTRPPAIVLREWVDGHVVREVRANASASASLDVQRTLCVAKTGEEGDAYDAVIAIAAGPVAELYGVANLDGWRQQKARNRVTYYNDGPGSVRQVTIDMRTGLPLEADTADGRWRWVIDEVDNDPPPAAPDVTAWPKESHERAGLTLDDGTVEDIEHRSTSLGKPLEFIALGEAERSTRVVVGLDTAYEGERFELPDGRTATVIEGEPPVARRAVEQVARARGIDQRVPYVAEEAAAWNQRINTLVAEIVPGVGGGPGSEPRPKPRPLRPPPALLAAIAIVGALAIPAAAIGLGLWPRAPGPSAAPATPSAEPSIVPVLGATLAFETLDVQRTGDWTGTAIVTPTGGIAPYAIEANGEARPNAQGAEQFAIGSSACAPVDVAATVRSQDGQSQQASGSYRPDRCADFALPPTPGLESPRDGSELRSNCTATPIALRGFAARGTPEGSTWTFEGEGRTDGDWTPTSSVSDLKEPVYQADLPCATAYRWRLAAVSPDGWQSEFSPWSTFTIRPTAIPVLSPPTLTSCSLPWPLTWTVDSTDGIASYVVEVADLKGAPVKVNVDGATASVYGECSTDYQWRGASVDAQRHRGQFSGWTPFTIPAFPPPG